MRNILAIVERELRAYFISPIAYVILTIFVFLSGLFFRSILSQVLQMSFAFILTGLIYFHAHRGEFEEAAHAAGQSIAIAKRLGAADVMAFSFNCHPRNLLLLLRGEWPQVRANLQALCGNDKSGRNNAALAGEKRFQPA